MLCGTVLLRDAGRLRLFYRFRQSIILFYAIKAGMAAGGARMQYRAMAKEGDRLYYIRYAEDPAYLQLCGYDLKLGRSRFFLNSTMMWLADLMLPA